MKIIISFLASAFVAAMTFAQEESASPAESTAPATEEKASATVEETPVVKPAEAAARAEKKAEAATSAKPAATAAAAKKEATTATAAAAAAPSGKKMTVRDMEEKWEASFATHDISAVQGFIAADFVGVSSQSKFSDRSSVLAEFKKDKDTYKSAKNEKLNVKNFGPNVTVVTGRSREKGTTKDGKPFDRTFLFTDTWMLRGGQWQCVASQVTKIKG